MAKMIKSLADVAKKIKALVETILKEMKLFSAVFAGLKSAAEDIKKALGDGTLIEKINKVVKDKKHANIKDAYEHAYGKIVAPKKSAGGGKPKAGESSACCTTF